MSDELVMGKRFTDTDKWRDPWFRKLLPRHKLFWSFICDNCDNAGVWAVDLDLAAFQCGYKFDEKDVLGAFDGRIRDIGKGRWWVVKFVMFQYGELSDRSKPHQHVSRLLARHTLSKEYAKTIAEGYGEGYLTLKEKDKDGKEEREETEEGKRKTRPASAVEVAAYCKSISLKPEDADYFWNKWVGNGFKNNKSPMKDWQAVIRSWKAAGHCPSQHYGNKRHNPESTRNVGTANQGKSSQYAGVGKIHSVPDAKRSAA